MEDTGSGFACDLWSSASLSLFVQRFQKENPNVRFEHIHRKRLKEAYEWSSSLSLFVQRKKCLKEKIQTLCPPFDLSLCLPFDLNKAELCV